MLGLLDNLGEACFFLKGNREEVNMVERGNYVGDWLGGMERGEN